MPLQPMVASDGSRWFCGFDGAGSVAGISSKFLVVCASCNPNAPSGEMTSNTASISFEEAIFGAEKKSKNYRS